MNTPTPLRLLALATLSLTTFTMLAGCSDTGSNDASSQADDHAGHDHDDHDHAHDSDTASTPDVYPGLLGEIRELPIEGDPTTTLKIHHQQIPNFKLKDGSINTSKDGSTGMMSMTMPFPLADGVTVEGLKIDDKVMFTFSVDWSGQGENAWEVTKIEKIDASTAIDFTNKIEELKDAAKDAVDSMIDDAKDNMPDMSDMPHTTKP